MSGDLETVGNIRENGARRPTMANYLMAAIELPETFNFLNAGWWIIHVIAISAVCSIGYLIGKKRRA